MTEISGVWANVVLREKHRHERQRLVRNLPSLSACKHSHYLSLGRFFDRIPERYFCQATFASFSKFLEDEHKHEPQRLRGLLEGEQAHLNQALFFLNEINRRTWHDRIEDSDEFEGLRFIDSYLHPDYLRLTDGVFFRFIRLIAMVSRLTRGVGTEKLDLYNAVNELQKSPLPELGALYRHIIRNGVAHGGVTFGRNEITYTDKNGNRETRSVHEVIRSVDDMVDLCNGMALALSLFLLVHIRDGYSIPQYLLIRELEAQTRSPWWRVDGCVPCEIPQGSQLLIYAHPNTRDTLKAHFYAFYTVALAELLAPGYDRYFLSLRSEKALPGFAAFDGGVLRRARERDCAGVSDYQGALVDDLLMYAPNIKLPRIFGKFDTCWQAARVNFPLAINQIRQNLNRPQLAVRSASIHKNGWYSLLNGSVVISSAQGPVTRDTVRGACRRVIAKAEAVARAKLRLRDPAKWLPLGWGRVSVFRRDYRQRRLSGFGLGADLVCTIQVQSLKRVRAPDIAGATIELKGQHRIAWNENWLEDVDGLEMQSGSSRCLSNNRT